MKALYKQIDDTVDFFEASWKGQFEDTFKLLIWQWIIYFILIAILVMFLISTSLIFGKIVFILEYPIISLYKVWAIVSLWRCSSKEKNRGTWWFYKVISILYSYYLISKLVTDFVLSA